MTRLRNPAEAVYGQELGFLLEQIDGRSLVDLTYEDLGDIARNWIRQMDRVLGGPSYPDEGQQEVMARVARLVARRRIAQLRNVVRPKDGIERAIFELVTMSRLRDSVVAYLSLQEGRHWDGSHCEFPRTARLLRQSMFLVGRRPPLTLGLSMVGMRIALGLDPARHVRALYHMLLRPPRWSSVRLAAFRFLHRSLFSVKAGLLRGLLRHFFTGRGAAKHFDFGRLFTTRAFKRNLAFLILLLFPGAKSLSEPQWNRLLDLLYDYFPARFATLKEIVPSDSLLNHGVIKLIKIGFGVIAARVSARPAEAVDEVAFIVTTLRLAYSWGITYPLVDNVLDSDSLSAELKQDLVSALRTLFADPVDDGPPVASAPVVVEVVDRLREVLSLTPAGRRPVLMKELRILLEAHRRDSARKLSQLHGSGEALATDVWADSSLKAAFIRIATMELCGTPVDDVRLATQFVSSLVNQLGDDLWDIGEDFANDRVTPFTLYLTRRTGRDPFTFFLRYCLHVVRSESPQRRLAMAIGVQETCRCLFESGEEAEPRSSGSVTALRRALDDLYPAGMSPDTMDIPHVDPDAVLFALESGVLTSRRPERSSTTPAGQIATMEGR